MSGDFENDNEWATSVAGEPFWLDVYRQAFPGFVDAHIPEGDGWHQRAGRDRIIVLNDSSTITVDEKGRREVWPDILVEMFSDWGKRVPGWGNPNKALNCNYIGYAFVPTQTCHLIPYRELRRIMAHGPGQEWWREASKKERENRKDGVHFVDARNPRDPNKPLRYWTRSLAVPTHLLLDAIRQSLTFHWQAPQPVEEDGWPEVQQPPDHGKAA
jgi:hypothetical protein